MTCQDSEGWHEPPASWEIVKRRFLEGRQPESDIATLSNRHGLDESRVSRVFSGEEDPFPELYVALSEETGMSQEFFKNLHCQHQEHMRC